MKFINQDGIKIKNKGKDMKKSIAKNYIYNLIYQLLTILLPLVTTPYLSRVLGAEPIGIYGYTISIVTYFILFGSLGVAMYGQREIAYLQNNKKDRTKTFLEIVIVRAISLTISMILFYFIFGRTGEYAVYYKILLIQMLANVFDISWFFQGLEEFGKTIIRNTIVKLLSLISIFVLVKQPSDLWKYFIILVASELIGNISLWFYLPKYVEKIKLKTLQLKKHIKPAIALFIPQIAIQIYTVLDKTMIGMLTNNMSEVGYYEQAQKVIRALILVMGSLSTVMSSRIASEYAKGNKENLKDCLEKSFNFVWFLGIPMMFGTIAISSKFVPWYYGEGFEPVINMLIATSPIILAIGLNNVTGIQYLIQTGKENIFTKSVVVGAIVNIILNFIFIKTIGTIGAGISSAIAEFIILFVQLKYFKEQFSIRKILKLSIKCFICGLIMLIVVLILTNYLSVSILNTIIEVAIGGIIYIALLFIMKYQFLYDIVNQFIIGIKQKLRTKKEI